MFQKMCLIMSSESERYSGIWYDLNNITLLDTYNYTKNPTAVNDVLCHYKNLAPQLQSHTPPEVVTFVHIDNEKIERQSEEKMGYHL